MIEWVEVADRVLLWRQPVLDVNATLIVGDTGALVVDTLSTPAQASELADAIRRVTPLPWQIANTHHHFDHVFGNATLGAGTEIWAHSECVARFERWGAERVTEIAAEYPIDGITDVTLLAPTRSVSGQATLDLGGRTVELRHLGRGHTDNDLVVVVPEARTVLAGDLLENGAPPSLEDSWPLEWAGTVAALLELEPQTVVPGHGAPMTPAQARAQHQELAAMEWAIRQGWHGKAPAEEVDAPEIAVRRAYEFLDGQL
ncbi:MBL fold metallo-hydrolase [Cryptosporangium phraense]|uniref:MBL fold metallo-hydrolase n=1 Tax=Cryptosporangium phraense TaxID=2593070 RepID=A0A545AF55_9ACTN|nr:MBL fold metallo-hydrolase [Cryptosporangium phraense]TQS39900.1 MBL fold metallo-hydrolase [Cryptosporangium phraense]